MPQAALKFEGEDARIDSRMIRDDRVRIKDQEEVYEEKEMSKLG
jgi:hypothetical protein